MKSINEEKDLKSINGTNNRYKDDDYNDYHKNKYLRSKEDKNLLQLSNKKIKKYHLIKGESKNNDYKNDDYNVYRNKNLKSKKDKNSLQLSKR